MPPLDIDSAHSLDHRQPDKPALCRSPVSGPPWSSRDPESHVRDPGAFNDPDRLQFDPSITEVLEEPYAAAKQRGHGGDLDLVEEPGTKAVLRNARPHQTHVLVTRCCLRLFDGALYAVCDERVRRLAFWDLFRHVVGDGEERELR